jgi:hypothetical protein
MTKRKDDFDLLELEAEFDKLPPEVIEEMQQAFEDVFVNGEGLTTFEEIFGDF